MTNTGNKSQYPGRVTVRARYLPEQSDPSAQVYRHAYTVTITNTGSIGAQLVSRHWIIESGQAQAQEVTGLGVVGHQPLLKPGQSFEYSSASQIPTPAGRMHGSYFFVAEDGTRFDVPIPAFTLSVMNPAEDTPSGRTLH